DILVAVADSATAAGREVLPDAVAPHVLAGRRILGRHLRPVAFELFGDELGEAGERALAHLGADDADDDGVVGLDDHPCGHFRSVDGARLGELGAERELQADGQTAAGRGGADEERTALHWSHDCHGCLPHALAASWIAARTCWKVPQRQMFVIAESMSASVGLGFSFKSETTAMIMPLWQKPHCGTSCAIQACCTL